jgi:tRNA threonylcarbamoyladenosine biosynthesis protein TsaB
VALLRDAELLALKLHDSGEDYSSWLLPAVEKVLEGAVLRMRQVGVCAGAAGPGSFTGVRVGLTTVKAWAEVYGKPVAAVSRLEAIAVQAMRETCYVAAFADAQRGQVFGAVYQREGKGLVRLGDEIVIEPARFIAAAAELCGSGKISWVSTDAAPLCGEAAWKARSERGEVIELVPAALAPTIGRLGLRQLREGKATDALGLDANYIRRSDAEIFWKSGAAHGR